MSRPCSFQSACYLFALLLFTAGGPALAQQDPLQVRNPIPWGSYQDSQIDTVNLLNGSLAFHIPLYSLPQRGQLSLSFSLKGTSPAYGFGTYTCTANNGLGPCFTGGFTWDNKLALVLDQALSAGVTQYRYPANSNTFYNVYSIADSNGSTHEVGYDNSNPQLLRATDGTGFLYNPTLTPPYTPFLTDWGLGTIYTASGIQHIHGTSAYTIRDADGNSIAMAMNCCGITQITDSLGRTLPPPPTGAASTSTTGCPAVTALYQATTGGSTWVVPGPNGTQLTFLLCYTSIYSHTDFFGGCLNHSNNCSGNYDGDGTTTNVLQAVVLPNGTYYLFTYGAANPSDSTSYGYADLTQIRLPSGGTINYQYANLPSTCTTASGCANHVVIGVNAARGVSNRVFDPGNGGQQASWTYAYTDYNSNTATVTDFQGNDTVLTFSYLGGSAGSPSCSNGNSSSVPYETKQQVYKGSHTSGTILRTKDTSYQITCGNPQSGTWRGSASIIAVLPTQVQTTLDNGLVTTTTHQYNDGGYADVQPACTAGANNSFTCTWSATQQVPFGLKTSTSFTDYGGTTLKTVNTQFLYQQNSSYYPGNFLDQVASVTTLNGSGAQMAQTTYGYDENNGSPQGIYANQTSINRWLNTTGAYLTSKRVYNTQGMVTQTIDPLLNATTFAYDSTGVFANQIQLPDTVTGAVTTHHITHYTYDPVLGKQLTSVDENSNQTSYFYDNMGRTTTITYPDGGQTTYCYTDNGGSTCTQTQPPYSVVTTRKVNSTQSETSTSPLDGLGRATQTQLSSDPDGTTYTATTYDGAGRTYQQYNATRCNPPTTNCSESTWGVTSNSYDPLGRICLVVPPDGTLPSGNTCPASQPSNTIFTTYSGNCTTVTDRAGKARKACSDALGRITQVFEDPASQNLETDYTYDALDNLLTVNQKGGSTDSTQWRPRTFVYDSLSRLTSSTNPESNTVPSTGATLATTYVYDANGNLGSKSTPAPNQTGSTTITLSYCYDALNRMTNKAYTAQSCPMTSPVASYFYDQTSYNGLTITNGIGRRTGMSDAPGAEAWSYDSMGRVLTDRRTTNGVTKSTAYVYSPYVDGSINTITYPSGRVVTDTTGTAERLLSVKDNSTNVYYAASAHYAPTGPLSSLTDGSSLVSTFFYNSRLQPCRISVKSSGTAPANCGDLTNKGNVLDFTYGYNLGSADNGNVAFIGNNRDNTRSQNFTYDAFNRIATAQTQTTGVTIPNSNCWGLTFGYDPWGNLSQQTISGPSGCGEPVPLSVTATTANRISSYCYDSAGNLLDQGVCPSGAHAYTYNAENQLTSAGSVTYTYDGDGKRVMKSNGKLYWFGTESDPLDETDAQGNTNNSGFFEYFFFGGRRVARRNYQDNVLYYFADQLGSARSNTTGSGKKQTQQLCYDADFYPFGGERIVTDTCDSAYKFTGKERDFESGLDNFGARFDSSSLGRFMSPDPDNAGASEDDPQSWNAYSYVMNDPLNLFDPDGLSDCDNKDPGKCIEVKADAPPPEPRISYSWRVVWENAGRAAQRANDYLHAAYQAVVNSRAACTAAYTAGGALAGATAGAGTFGAAGAGGGAAVGLAGGPAAPVTVPVGAGVGGGGAAIIGGIVGGIGGGGLGYATGQAVCSSGTGTGGGGGGGGKHFENARSRAGWDPNRVIREGRKFTDSESGYTVHVDGNRVVITDPSKGGEPVTMFENSAANTQQRIQSGKWIPQ